MKRTITILFTFAASIAALGCTEVRADPDTSPKLGEHPAIIAARVYANAGYDYASKMYRHPAGLALYLEAPREMGEHPAVLVHRNWSKRGYDDASKIASHPALPKVAAVPPDAPGLVLDHSAVAVANAAAKQEPRSTSER